MTEPVAFGDDLAQRRRIGVAARDQAIEAAQRLAPFQREDRVLDGQHRWGVDGFTLEHAFSQLALGHQAEHLGQRPGGGVVFQTLDGTGAQDQHAMAALAAQHLLPGEGGDVDLGPVDLIGEDRAGGVGEGQALAVGRNPVGIGHAHARGGAVPGEQHIVREVDGGKVGQLAIVGTDHGRVELQLLGGVRHPAFAEAFPGQRRHRAGAQHRPHRHFEGTGVATRHDADAVGVGQVQQLAHQVDAVGEAGLADLGAVRTAERLGGQLGGIPARRLGAGTGREKGASRTGCGLCGRRNGGVNGSQISHVMRLLTESTRGVGTAWPVGRPKDFGKRVKPQQNATK